MLSLPKRLSRTVIVLVALLLTFLPATAPPANAKPSLSAQFAPVAGQVTSNFGWRSDPLGGGRRFHSGLDIAAPQGSPVYAPQNAYVAFSGPYKGYGNVVVLDHGYGLYTLYGHASALYVSKGQAVHYGQIIAAVGTTGRSTGPHLHFEVHQGGQYVNPVTYLSWLSGQIQHNIAQSKQKKNQGRMLAAFDESPIRVTIQSQDIQSNSGQALDASVGETGAMGGPLADESATKDVIKAQSSAAGGTPSTYLLGKPSNGVSIQLGASD